MPGMIFDTLSETPQATPQVAALLEALGNGKLSRSELQVKLELKDAKSFRDRYLNPALNDGWIEMTLPEKPNSPKQRYRRRT